jgi:hypothetical protein
VFDHPRTAGVGRLAGTPAGHKGSRRRRRDADDIRFLAKHLGLASADEVLTLCADVFPDEDVPDRARPVLGDIFDDQ